MYRLTVIYTVIYKVISALTFYHFNSGNYISMNFLLNCLEISPKTIILLMDRHDLNSNNRPWPNKRMNSWYCSSWQRFTEKNRQIVGFHGCKKRILLITQLIECLFSFCTFPVVVFCWLFFYSIHLFIIHLSLFLLFISIIYLSIILFHLFFYFTIFKFFFYFYYLFFILFIYLFPFFLIIVIIIFFIYYYYYYYFFLGGGGVVWYVSSKSCSS